MDEMQKELLKRFASISMGRLLELETQEERDAYMLGMSDVADCMNQLAEAEEQKRHYPKPKPLGMSERIEAIWESRMGELNEMDADTFSFYINRMLFGDENE